MAANDSAGSGMPTTTMIQGRSFCRKGFGTSTAADSISLQKTFLIPFGDLSAGDYEVRVTARELEGNPVTKVFPFQIKDGKLVGDAEITKKAFMKKHKIRLLEREYVYLKEKP